MDYGGKDKEKMSGNKGARDAMLEINNLQTRDFLRRRDGGCSAVEYRRYKR